MAHPDIPASPMPLPPERDGFALFETAIGVCAVVWSPRGIAGVQLPESSERAARARLARLHPGATEAVPPEPVARAIADMTGLLDGKPTDLAELVLDLEGVGAFEARVYEFARAIAPGATATYGEIAQSMGDPGAARAVGQALGANPFPIVVPCHRVLGAGGKSGGFSAPGGLATKARMLNQERARTSPSPMLFDVLPVAFRGSK